MIKELIPKDVKATLNMYVPNNSASKYMKYS